MELQILHWFESLHNPVTDPIMYGITCLGNAGIFWIILAVAMLFILPKKYRKVGFAIAVGLILSLIMCNGVMKNLWHRVRPFNADPTFGTGLYNIFAGVKDWSFPSGHSSASFAGAVAIFMWYKKEGSWALVLATLIAVSRLYLNVHYPTDVLVGIISGAIYGLIGYLVTKWLMGRFKGFNDIIGKGKSYKNIFKKSKA